MNATENDAFTAEEFVKWLHGLLDGDDERRTGMARPTVTTEAKEFVNGELRPSLVAFFGNGDGWVITVNKVGPRP